MASLQFPPAPSVYLLPSFLRHYPSTPHTFSHISSNPKISHSPYPSTISFSSSLRPISAAAATSFPYSQLQHRQYLKQDDSVNERRRGDFADQPEEDDDELFLGTVWCSRRAPSKKRTLSFLQTSGASRSEPKGGSRIPQPHLPENHIAWSQRSGKRLWMKLTCRRRRSASLRTRLGSEVDWRRGRRPPCRILRSTMLTGI
ncbi:hypothetical protein KSP40_PGU022128 [Platanthera guangdongensis]|uniref:Uncharacterized protein n=1 Tax=Platanthera guangdongensis TaxID=2320717 RepID=A0ABR2LM34_9ASPA